MLIEPTSRMRDFKFHRILSKSGTCTVRILVNYPGFTISFAFVILFLTCFTGIWYGYLPNFENPDKGFLPRGTVISDRRVTSANVARLVRSKSLFTINDMINSFESSSPGTDESNESLATASGQPQVRFGTLNTELGQEDASGLDETEEADEIVANLLSQMKTAESAQKRAKRDLDKKSFVKVNVNTILSVSDLENDDPASVSGRLGELHGKLNKNAVKKIYVPSFHSCFPTLNDDCAQIILEAKEPAKNSLMSLDGLNLQCQFVEQYLKPYLNQVLLSQNSPYEVKFESLASVITRFSNKKSCSELNSDDLGNFTLIFRFCSPIYKRLGNLNLVQLASPASPLTQAAQEQLQMSPICLDQNLIDAHRFLVDRWFYFTGDEGGSEAVPGQLAALQDQELDSIEPAVVRFTSIYISVNKQDSKFLTPFYLDYLKPNFLNKPLSINENKNYHVIGLNFNIKFDLFNRYIWSSLVYLAIAVAAILLVTLVYLRNFFLTLIVFICILFAMCESYFVYVVLFKLEFFPFLNLVSTFLLIGLACDNVYFLHDTWCEAKLKFKYLLSQSQVSEDLNASHDVSNSAFAAANLQRLNASKSSTASSTKPIHKRLASYSLSKLASLTRKSNRGASSSQTNNQSRASSNHNTTASSSRTLHHFYNSMFITYLENCVVYTFKNAVSSVFVTSFTTAAAFLVNLSSNVPTIRLFGFFSSLAIIVYFLLMILIVPCLLVLQSKYSAKVYRFFYNLTVRAQLTTIYNSSYFLCLSSTVKNRINIMRHFYLNLFEKYLPDFVVAYRGFLLFFFAFLGLTGFVLVLHKPGLALPKSSTFQFFTDSNPLEFYDKYFSSLSETNGIYFYQQESKPYLRVNYVFGLKARDSGDRLNPDDLGKLTFDHENFNFYDESSQIWFAQFCKSVKATTLEEGVAASPDDKVALETTLSRTITPPSYDDPSLQPAEGPEQAESEAEAYNKNRVCLFDMLKIVLARKCTENAPPSDLVGSVCCNQEAFPLDSNVLELCLKNTTFLSKYVVPYQNILFETLYYNRSSGLVSALELQQMTALTWSASYERMRAHYETIEAFFKKQLRFAVVDLSANAEATSGFGVTRSAFFVSEFDFFDLQGNIVTKTLQSFVITLAVVTLIILLSTRNYLITIYAVFSIVLILASTVGTLALFGWQLSIVESVSIVLAIGLSIDFVVHLAMSYGSLASSRFAPNDTACMLFYTRQNITKEAFKHVGSAVFMASLTTVCAGSLTLPSPLVAFRTFGMFLIVVTLYSILYSFFFFLPICAYIGPTNGCGQIKPGGKSAPRRPYESNGGSSSAAATSAEHKTKMLGGSVRSPNEVQAINEESIFMTSF